jgi:hypothetical protein
MDECCDSASDVQWHRQRRRVPCNSSLQRAAQASILGKEQPRHQRLLLQLHRLARRALKSLGAVFRTGCESCESVVGELHPTGHVRQVAHEREPLPHVIEHVPRGVRDLADQHEHVRLQQWTQPNVGAVAKYVQRLEPVHCRQNIGGCA